MSRNPTNRRLAVAGPSSEVRWLVERARGRLGPPVRARSAWRPRSELSFRALADLLPFELRPPQIPEEIECVWLHAVWESRKGMSLADWSLTDYEWPDDKLPVLLLAALSARYRNLCFIMAEEDTDTLEAGSTLIWRGRVRRRKARDAEVTRMIKVIWPRYGLSPDGDDGDEDVSSILTAEEDLNNALLDHVQREWDKELERLLRGLSKRAPLRPRNLHSRHLMLPPERYARATGFFD